MAEQVNKYFAGIPPASSDILSWYCPEAVTISGAHIQVQQAPSATATFQLGSALSAGGSGFNITIASGALEGIVTGQSLSIAAGGYLYLYATTPAGCGDINIVPYMRGTTSLVTQAEAQAYCQLPDGQWTAEMDAIHLGVEAAIQQYCNRTFAVTTYNERYDGTGKPYLFLRQYPLIDVLRISIGTRTAIFLLNTNENVTANVSVTSTGLRLTYQDSTDTTVTWASNDTISDVVTAINALGNGWTATLANSNYGSFKSEELAAVGRQGLNAADDNQVELAIPERAEDGIEAYADAGYVYRSAGWPMSARNIYVRYTAGYETIPYDIQQAVKICVKHAWQKRDEESYGLSSANVAGVNQQFVEDWAPPEALKILQRHRRRMI